jgi:hypothetical protein
MTDEPKSLFVPASERLSHAMSLESANDIHEQAKRDIEIKKSLYEETFRLREVLKTARRQLVTLGGDREYGSGDAIHAAVLDEIDKALCYPRTDQGA